MVKKNQALFCGLQFLFSASDHPAIEIAGLKIDSTVETCRFSMEKTGCQDCRAFQSPGHFLWCKSMKWCQQLTSVILAWKKHSWGIQHVPFGGYLNKLSLFVLDFILSAGFYCQIASKVGIFCCIYRIIGPVPFPPRFPTKSANL